MTRYILWITILGLTLGGLYFVAIDLQDRAFIYGQHQNVIAGVAGSPYRYRVLVPFLLEALTRVFSVAMPREVAFLAASLVYDCLAFVAQLLILFALVRQFFSRRQAFVGLTYIAGLSVLTLAYFTYQPWSILEVALFALGFLLAYRGRWVWVGVVVVLGALNRETGVFLPLALLLASLGSLWPLRINTLSRETRIAFGLVVLSTAIFAGLRLVRGSAPAVDPLGLVVARNLERNNLIAAGGAVVLFLGLGWYYACRGLPSAPNYVRRLARVVPFYLAAFVIWGWWREVRILTSLYPILLPLVLTYCYAPRAVSLVAWPRAAA